MEQLTASSAQTTMVGFFSQQPNITADVAGVNSSAGTDVATPSPGHSTPCVSSVEVKQFAERAVVLWALKTVANHFFKSSFKLQDTRLDDFYTGLLSDKDGFGELWSVVKQVLIMSHGNATVEGGFSVNADMLIENMKEESLVAQRRVYDAVRHAGGPLNVDITPELMKSVAGSNRRYRLALESRAVNEAKAEEQRKQKCDVAALEELKKRKKAVEAEQAAQSRELAAQIREVEDSLRK